MQQRKLSNPHRRQFLITSVGVGTGLTLGLYLPGCSRDDTSTAGPGQAGGKAVTAPLFEPNAFVRITKDSRVIVISKHLEMGQGTYTGLATLVAEELDADWDQVEVHGAPADASRYNNLFWGPMQGTGGSTAMANSFEQMRKAGAAARHMLIAAAAKQWKVDAEGITIEQGVLQHKASNKQASFGDMAELASQQAVPEDVFLKEPEDFKLIGKDLHRKDNTPKIYGKAIYTQDIKLPDLLTALVAHPPRFGAKVKSFDASDAKAITGVSEVVQIPNGVAVLAKDFWSAKKGRDALNIEWDESAAMTQGTDEILAQYKELLKNAGTPARKDGDANSAMAKATQTVEAVFEFPYLAHAAMEPMNCVMRLSEQGCEIWNGEQLHTGDQMAVAKTLGLTPEQVTIHMLYAGGSFGRRANPLSDYVVEAATIVKAINGKAPIKLVWTREDDMHGGYYRPLYVHHIKAGLDAKGMPIAWQQRIVGQSIAAGTAFEGMIKDGVDATSVEGATNMPYAIPNIHIDLHSPTQAVPVQWWRSVGSTHTAYVCETMIDELAAKAGQDPLSFRRQLLLKHHPRHLGVMELAAEKAGWGKPLAAGRGRGLAVHESFNSYVAQVAEVTVNSKDKTFSVDRVVVAVDCGIAVNPDVIRAQMEGGLGFGLAAALSSKITLKEGRVEQSNFHDYTVLRIDQMPEVEVHIINSAQPPTGVGEPATPVIAPAVANALYGATGKRFHTLPLSL